MQTVAVAVLPFLPSGTHHIANAIEKGLTSASQWKDSSRDIWNMKIMWLQGCKIC
jgi:hypothetical protein